MGNETSVGAALRAGLPEIDRDYRLEHNRDRLQGRIFLTGTQALVRMLLLQKKMDERAGLRTAGFVTGYRGSPLAAVDMEMWRAQPQLEAANVRFLPAVNEDLAATAAIGTQQVGGDPDRQVDGVFAMWYGKGPGVDRAGDAIRHGNAAGTSAQGGVLMIVGDDHAATSSSIPNASDLSLLGWGIPIVHPASVEEYVDFGLWGWAASRASGLWVALKAVSETVESGRSMEAGPLPWFRPPEGVVPVGLGYRTDDFLTPAIEVRLAARLKVLEAFARANPLDRLVVPAPQARLGIIAVGKAWHDVLDVLAGFGLDLAALEQHGIRLYKPGLVYPLAGEGATAFARGLEHVLVVEEKAALVEQQLKDLVFHWDERPTISGRHAIDGADLVPWVGQLRPATLAAPVLRWLAQVAPGLVATGCREFERPPLPSNEADGMRRLPYFCSGCPHNTSTQVPEGSVALAGVGCHYMASWMDRRTAGLTQMGGEGADWVGHAPFTARRHVFQNMGEGTYFHSGFLAIRQAIAARATITYKILFNDAVAMTGGQPVDGTMSVAQICRELRAEGARRVVVVTDQPELYAGVDLEGLPVRHRRELDAVQRELREIEGVTALVYDQTCAAEKRRRRKKNKPDHEVFPDPARRLVINPAVCEGCGDCGVQSNCLSIAPLETPLGRKRRIDQASCNKDYSCVEGFCPSFVSVRGGSLRAAPVAAGPDRAVLDALLQALPLPAPPPLDAPYDILVAGVGGTGVITIGQVVAMAAHLEGRGASVLDFTALAQKGGSVVSHLRLAPDPSQLHAVRLEWQRARVLVACDLVVAALPDVLATVRHGVTRIVANTQVQTLAEFTRDADADPKADALLAKLRAAASADRVTAFDAREAAQRVVGDAMASNMFLLGHAWQLGLVPVSLPALDRALELNGVAVEQNRRAFACGRLSAHDPAWLARTLAPREQVVQLVARPSLDRLVAERRAHLAAYQDAAYARRYEEVVARVRTRERELRADGREPLAEAVAKSLHQLMAYKDEYEVARLHADPAFVAGLRDQFEGDWRLSFHLAPPLLARRNAQGHLVKREFGAWMLPAFGVLARLKGLRGTPLDIFGYTQERRMERALVREFEALVDRLLPQLTTANAELAAEIARLPQAIRGFGHVKERNVAAFRERLAALQAQFFGA